MKTALRFVILLLISASANILYADDNCCHTPGWNCQSEGDWIEGYHASRANECEISETAGVNGMSAATQEVSATPVPSSDESTPSDQPINNCCHTGWHCSNNNEWVAAYYAFQENQCESSTLDQAVRNQQTRRASNQQANQLVSRVETVDPETGKTTTVFTYEDGVEIIVRPPTRSVSFVMHWKELGRELPDYC